MQKLFFIAVFLIICNTLWGQGFELYDFNAQAKAHIGESLIIPLKVRNNTDKPVILVIQELRQNLGSTQKHNFCLGNDCLDSGVKEFSKILEPGTSLSNLVVQVEAGLVPGQGSIHYRIFNKNTPLDFTEVEIHVLIEEKLARNVLYKTENITINEIYPNPVIDQGFIDYQIHTDGLNPRILVHNVLGNIIAEYPLSFYENRLKLKTEELSPGIYFLTLYLENQNVLTRKLIVRK